MPLLRRSLRARLVPDGATVARESANPVVLWRLFDGKPGHEGQTLGLVNALKQLYPCVSHDLPVPGISSAIRSLVLGHWMPGTGLPPPHFIIGAGHGTHWHLLAARRAHGGKAIVLMRPSVPVSWFDLCLIPEHDDYRGGGCFFETRGVLNPIHAAHVQQANRSLILVGGPSRHFAWDAAGLLGQIGQLVGGNPGIDYWLTSSRRTPPDFIDRCRALDLANLRCWPVAETPPGWVAEQLALSASAWVTEDSVSMVYEALTVGSAVGLLALPDRGAGRVTRGLQRLLDEGWVCRFDGRGEYRQRLRPVAGFNEAERCARWIGERWLCAG